MYASIATNTCLCVLASFNGYVTSESESIEQEEGLSVGADRYFETFSIILLSVGLADLGRKYVCTMIYLLEM